MAEVDVDAAFELLVAEEANVAASSKTCLQSIATPITTDAHVEALRASAQHAAALRAAFVEQAASWVQYAVDATVAVALCKKISSVFEAEEAMLPLVVPAFTALGKNPSILPGADAQKALVAPFRGLMAFVDFLFAISTFLPGDATVTATFHHVQDITSAAESAIGLLNLQQSVQTASPIQFLNIVDPFRTIVREGDVQAVFPGKRPMKAHLWLFNDAFMVGVEVSTAGTRVIEATGDLQDLIIGDAPSGTPALHNAF